MRSLRIIALAIIFSLVGTSAYSDTPPPIVVVPDTVNVNAPTESDDNVVGSSITKVAQAAFAAFTVTMNPPPIFTTSPAIGKVPVLVELTKLTVDQVVLTFQAADALEK